MKTVSRRAFRLTYPCAVAALAAIVGGAPSSSITGCAAPPARAPEAPSPPTIAPLASARPATSPTAMESAPPAVEPPPLVATRPLPIESSPAAHASAPPALAPPPKKSRPHVWKSGELQEPLDGLASWVEKNGGRLSAELMDATSGARLAGVAESTPENPASNQKIVTAAAVLRHFEPSFRFRTAVCGARVGGQVPLLVIRGVGDPSLSSADLRALAHALALLGINQVGELALDQTYFDSNYTPPAFDQQPGEWAAFRAPVSALSLDRNVTTLNVAPTEGDRAAKVWFDPEGFVDVTGSVLTAVVREGRKAIPAGGERAEQEASRGRREDVKLTLSASGARLSALIAGRIAPRGPAFHWSRRVEDPSLLAGYGLKAALTAEGIQLVGAISLAARARTDTECPELAAHESKPLSELLEALGKDSDNFYAETLLKDLGAKVRGTPATSENGAAAVLDYLRRIEALDPGTRISNGSGLFDANRLSARSLVTTLRQASRDPTTGPAFIEQLAIGGVDGTLKHRFIAFRKPRSIRAKTGTLDRVTSLSGLVSRPDGSSPVAFSLIVVGIANHAEVRKRIDEIVSSVAKALAKDAS